MENNKNNSMEIYYEENKKDKETNQENDDSICSVSYSDKQGEYAQKSQEITQINKEINSDEYNNINIEDTAIDLPPDCVEITCPECKKEVIIDSSNICPNCGCEFEEIEKHFRLTRIGTLFGMVTSAIYLLSLILLRFLTQPVHIKEDSLFYMDSFRFTDINTIISMIILSALLTISYIFVTIAENNKFYKISVVVSLVLSIINMYVLYTTELQNSFYFFTKLIFLLTFAPIVCSVLCFVDMFIHPKSKLNR